MSTQINLKVTEDFFIDVKHYADEYGYMSIQELAREALRDKIYEEAEIREEYKKVLESKEANTFSSIEDSKKFIEGLKKKAGLL